MSSNRAIDQAMSEERPPKKVIRGIWVDQAQRYKESRGEGVDVPLFLTLCGEHAHDIQMLVEAGIIELNEVDGIDQASANLIAAVENNSQAASSARRRIPGLDVIVRDFQSIMHGDSLTAFPKGNSDVGLSRSQILNLDFNQSLKVGASRDVDKFPLFDWITKVSIMHSKAPPIDWCLCLTLNATIENWPTRLCTGIQAFLKDNFDTSAGFKDQARDTLGTALFSCLDSGSDVDFNELSDEECQRLLMTYVPKKVTRMVNSHGCQVETKANYCYRGGKNAAPMVTWVLDFSYLNTPDIPYRQVYLDGLSTILSEAAAISDDGEIDGFTSS